MKVMLIDDIGKAWKKASVFMSSTFAGVFLGWDQLFAADEQAKILAMVGVPINRIAGILFVLVVIVRILKFQRTPKVEKDTE